jgi:hypothetical protein
VTAIPIRIAVRVDFSDGAQHEYEVRGQDAAEPLPGTQFWPEGVVTADVRKRQEYDRQRQEIIRRLRQALWDIYTACGEDAHGDAEAPPPGLWTPDIDSLALSAVKMLRQDYDDALAEAGD